MAEKRMFAKSIVESDAFLDMPASSQALYLHLNMAADDEGFVNNPKKIMRICGCAEDDLRLLILKKFIINFDSGIVVIKHWKVNNYLQNDRTKPSVYDYEKSLLFVKPNKAYTLDSSKGKPLCIQNVYKVYPQSRLIEINIEEINREEVSIEHREIYKKYFNIFEGKINPSAATTILSLIKNFGQDFFDEAYKIAIIRKNVRLDYIIGILESWKKKNFKTIEDIKKEQKKEDNFGFEYQQNPYSGKELEYMYEN